MSAPGAGGVILDRRIVDNAWLSLADEAALPAAGKVIVSLKRFRIERDALDSSGLVVGVRIPNTEDAARLGPELAAQPLIAVEIPKFADGRAYSQARVLRERCAYRGEIRAQGEVLRDQLLHMSRCGINAFELRADQDAQDCLRAFADHSLVYQAAADGAETVWQMRRRQAQAATQ